MKDPEGGQRAEEREPQTGARARGGSRGDRRQIPEMYVNPLKDFKPASDMN